MTTRVSTNCKIFIGPVAADTVDTVGEFAALSYTEIGQIMNLGEFGDQSNIITAAYLNTGRNEKYKGIRDAGTMNIEVGLDESNDAGQAAVVAAEKLSSNYAIKVTLDDAGAGSPSNPTTYYFRGQIIGWRRNIGGPDAVVTARFDVGVNSEILTVPAV